MAIKVLYTATAVATGGRNGHTQSEDGLVSVNLSVPKAMGGPGKEGATTPEHLFAAGYAACFGSSCEFMSRQLRLIPKTIEVKSAVGIGPNNEGGFGLVVDLHVRIEGLAQEDAERVVAAGHKACPYSNAIKGNVDVTIKVVADQAS
ncbi:MAG: organic hydroperoxide resistance protein [Desulfobacterales bacterium]|nr:organic hydroperoxide resistance protein [Desulfobacterales bacterium]